MDANFKTNVTIHFYRKKKSKFMYLDLLYFVKKNTGSTIA